MTETAYFQVRTRAPRDPPTLVSDRMEWQRYNPRYLLAAAYAFIGAQRRALTVEGGGSTALVKRTGGWPSMPATMPVYGLGSSRNRRSGNAIQKLAGALHTERSSLNYRSAGRSKRKFPLIAPL